MKTRPVPPERLLRNVHKPPIWTVLARIFPATALCATLFGLFMLVVFFWRIGTDVAYWFQTMPALVEQRNEVLAEKAAEARKLESLIAREMLEIDEEMAQELRAAGTAKEKDEIRKDYAKIRARRTSDKRATAQELLRDESDIRPHPSPVDLLGYFLTHSPSNEPQDVGIMPALLGSIYLGLITLLFAVPLGVGAAIYLEEYRASSWLAHVIQVNINNLAGVPSVMFGILGAFVFVEFIFKPLESPTIAARNVLGGGLTLALLTLPVIIIASQEALRTVPSSLRHAAYALGATRWQVVQKVVLPSSLPGILTGIILALSRALGEAAPLVLFGALLFVNHNPTLFSRFTVLPMQIFGWADRPADVWRYNAALASAVLIVLLLGLNAIAIYLRQRAQKKQIAG